MRTLNAAILGGVLMTITGTGWALAPSERGQAPYHGSPIEIPGRIEAEDFDEGGEGVAYHDTTVGNNGGDWRDENVDIVSTEDIGPTDHLVGWVEGGEWLEYSVNVQNAGLYHVRYRVASASNGPYSISLELDGQALGTSKTFAETLGWHNWVTVQSAPVQLPAGQATLKVKLDTSSFNINWIEFIPVGACPSDTLLRGEGEPLTDEDGDGFADVIEEFYGSDHLDGSDHPSYFGDINGDGVTNMQDALMLRRLQLRWPQAPEDCHLNVKLDGAITQKDSATLFTFSIGGLDGYVIPIF